MNAVVQSVDVYQAAARERIRRLSWLRAHPEELPALKQYYKKNIADFINDWGITVDPRNAGTDKPVVMPFLLDARQREWVEWTVDNWRRKRYGITVKSRDVGLSWLIVAVGISLAVLFDNMAVGWGSFKQEKVDWAGDMGSIFEKGRAYLEALPVEFRAGYDRNTCSRQRRLSFPETAAQIIGEIGDQIGRGARTAVYFVDETAYLERDWEVDAALSKTTPCRQDVSSVHGMENSFAIRAHQKSILENEQRFDFHWRHNPRFSEREYAEFLELHGPVITAQELDCNFQASVEGIVIPAAWVISCIDAHVKLGIKAVGEYVAALDVADLGVDKNALAIRHGILLEHLELWSGSDKVTVYNSTERAFRLCDEYGPTRRLTYDQDGVGADVRGAAKKIHESRNPAHTITVKPFRGSAAVLDPTREMVPGRKNEDYFLNYKAQCWWWLRLLVYNTHRAVTGESYDAERLMSIAGALPHLQSLLIEISRPTYSQNQAGKLLIDKQPEGKPSPNLADAVMMVYAPGRRPMRINAPELEEI